jgi:hypothetical protein
LPAARSSLARAVTASVGEGFTRCTRSDNLISNEDVPSRRPQKLAL